jgi:hypothetical protein
MEGLGEGAAQIRSACQLLHLRSTSVSSKNVAEAGRGAGGAGGELFGGSIGGRKHQGFGNEDWARSTDSCHEGASG